MSAENIFAKGKVDVTKRILSRRGTGMVIFTGKFQRFPFNICRRKVLIGLFIKFLSMEKTSFQIFLVVEATLNILTRVSHGDMGGVERGAIYLETFCLCFT